MNSSEEEGIGLNITISTPGASTSNTTSSSTYVSCIKIDGRPILPPLMTDAKRAEMRRYKELAINLEIRLNQKKKQKQEKEVKDEVVPTEQLDAPQLIPVEPATAAAVAPFHIPSISIESQTPSPGFDQHFVTKKTPDAPSASAAETANSQNEEPLIQFELDNEKENGKLVEDENDSESSSDIFASVSSNGTFIIKKGEEDAGEDDNDNLSQHLEDADDNDGARSEGEVSSPSDKENEPDFFQSPLNEVDDAEKEGFLLSSRRKRPAFYFDEADDDDVDVPGGSESDIESEATTLDSSSKGTSSISLNPFLPPDVTWSSSLTGTSPSVASQKTSTSEQHKSKSDEHSETASSKQDQRRQRLTPRTRSRGGGTPGSGGSYDVTLSTKIPSSAENTPIKKPDEQKMEKLEQQSQQRSDSQETDSDKENHDTSRSSQASSHKKHVRKLSYTLDQPSDALIASGMKSADLPEDKEDVGLAPLPLSTIPSSNVTPVKFGSVQNPMMPPNSDILTMATPTAEELDHRLEALDRRLAHLQVGVELNKKQHLERYMEDVTVAGPNTTKQSSTSTESSPRAEAAARRATPIRDFQVEIEQKFNELQLQQQRQLEHLMQVHKEQEKKLKEDFDRQRAFLMGQLKGIPTPKAPQTQIRIPPPPPPPPLFPRSLPTTPVKPDEEDASSISVKSFTSLQNSKNPFNTPAPRPATTEPVVLKDLGFPVVDLESRLMSAASTSTSYAPTAPNTGRSTFTTTSDFPMTPITATGTDTTDFETETKSSVMSGSTTTNTLTEIGSVGLSKLQAKMKALSPQYRKMGAEARSPLLKGVAFPNPLNRSYAPVRVPPKALEPEMAPKYARITACVRGYLTRRLLHTDKIQAIIQTIRDTVDFVLRLYEENPNDPTHLQIRPEDLNLHRMLIQQLNGACSSFHGIFFKLTTPERMAIIATDRQKLKAKALKEQTSYSNTSMSGSSKNKRNISAATMKAIERRLSFAPNANGQQQQPPTTPVYHHQSRKVPAKSSISNINNNAAATAIAQGSKSVGPKAVGKPKLGISPCTKRRRLSSYVFKPPRNVSATIDTGLPKSVKRGSKVSTGRSTMTATPKFTRPDQNGNNWKPRQSVASSSSSQQAQQLHNVTYTMKPTTTTETDANANSNLGFQANPTRLETNFTGGADLPSPEVFMNYVAESNANARASTSSNVSKQNINTSAHSVASSSSRFSLGSNHSAYYSSRASMQSSRASGAGRKSLGGGGKAKAKPSWK